jgi:hypothetical protein
VFYDNKYSVGIKRFATLMRGEKYKNLVKKKRNAGHSIGSNFLL